MKKWFNKQTISMFLAGVLISVLSTCVFAVKTIESEYINADELEKQPGVLVNIGETVSIMRREGRIYEYYSTIPTNQIYFNVNQLKSKKLLP
ncbi:MAG: hypothetical protein PHH61_06265 [Candidatus Nanoarchaeia archaeon]|nr:hypothetical protein [Candidatus Nanoarchaeia archaeon]